MSHRVLSIALLTAVLILIGGLQFLFASPAAAHSGPHHQAPAHIAVVSSPMSRDLTAPLERYWQAKQGHAIAGAAPRCPSHSDKGHCNHECGSDGACCAAGCGAAIESGATAFDPSISLVSRRGVPQHRTLAAAFTSFIPRPPDHAV